MGSFYIKTEYDIALEMTFIYLVGHLENEADCVAMHDGCVELHATHPPNSYFVAVMDMFSVAPPALSLFLEYAGRISSHNRGICAVVDFSATDSRAVADSVDKLSGEVHFAPTIEEGVALLKKIRASRARGRWAV